MPRHTLERWTAEKSAELYGVRDWARGFFDVSPNGEAIVTVRGPEAAVSLLDIVSDLRRRGLSPPFLLRFSDVLEARICRVNEAFRNAIRQAGYNAPYRAAFPIKVNQQQHVIEDVLDFGRPYHHGLEVGSKAELIAAMGLLDDPEALLICNGYKDEEFIRLALFAQKLGLQVFIVLEMPGELDAVLRCSQEVGVEPRLGIRLKLATRAGGHWTESGGDRSVFGLTASEIVDVLDRLRAENRLHLLQMLHFHLGSQIPNIRDIRTAIREAARFYVELVREGAPIRALDVGGGLAVDYDGSQTNYPSSRNYTMDEYCGDIVYAVQSIADEAGIPHPMLVSESGRAVAAHHAVLVFDVLDVTKANTAAAPPASLPPDAHSRIHDLAETLARLTPKNLQECFHDAVFYRDELRALFVHGAVGLRERALGERLFWTIMERIAAHLKQVPHVPEELQHLPAALADVYYGNFSVFQSLPDAWAVDQLFPVMPLHRLQERPIREAIVSDITCDCDGKIDRFIDLHDVRRSLALHALRPDEPYYVGVFFVGAYQETLGDLHNLFGDPHVIGVRLDGRGGFDVVREIAGDTVKDVLTYMEYDVAGLQAHVEDAARRAAAAARLEPEEAETIVEAYRKTLRGYTYFRR